MNLRRIIAHGLLVILVLPSALDGNPASTEQKSITRTADPVVILGSELKELIGAPVNQLTLMRFCSDGFEPIPFQIDERTRKGDLAYSKGKLARGDEDPNLDANDELAFMVNDLGDRAPKELQLPPELDRGLEIEVIDPVTQAKGWVYLFVSLSKSPKRSPVDYIRLEFDPKTNHKRVRTNDLDGYGLIIGSPLDAIYPDEFKVVFPDGTVGADILDRLKIRGVMKTRVDLDIDFKFDEMAKAHTSAWIDGPVRAIYRADGYLELGKFNFSGTGYSEIVYYRNSMIWPMYIEIPFSLNSFLDELELRGYMDYNQNVIGHFVYSESNPAPPRITLDGIVSDEEKTLDFDSECDWIVGYGPLGATIARVKFPPEWSMVKKRFYLNEDLSTPAPPEDDPGEIGVGFRFDGFEKAKALKATYYQYYYFLPRFEPGQEKPILEILDHPLEFKVRKYQ